MFVAKPKTQRRNVSAAGKKKTEIRDTTGAQLEGPNKEQKENTNAEYQSKWTAMMQEIRIIQKPTGSTVSIWSVSII